MAGRLAHTRSRTQPRSARGAISDDGTKGAAAHDILYYNIFPVSFGARHRDDRKFVSTAVTVFTAYVLTSSRVAGARASPPDVYAAIHVVGGHLGRPYLVP